MNLQCRQLCSDLRMVLNHCTIAQFYSTKGLRRFKYCSRHVVDLQLRGSPAIVPAENKAKRLSSVNHAIKTSHHHHKVARIILITLTNVKEGRMGMEKINIKLMLSMTK